MLVARLRVDHGDEVVLRDDAYAHLVEERAIERPGAHRKLAVALRDARGRETDRGGPRQNQDERMKRGRKRRTADGRVRQ